MGAKVNGPPGQTSRPLFREHCTKMELEPSSSIRPGRETGSRRGSPWDVHWSALLAACRGQSWMGESAGWEPNPSVTWVWGSSPSAPVCACKRNYRLRAQRLPSSKPASLWNSGGWIYRFSITSSSQMWQLGWRVPSQVSRGGAAHLWSGAVPRFLPGRVCSRTLTLQRLLSENPKESLLGLPSCETAKTPLTSWCGEVPAPPWGLLPAWQFRKKARSELS